MGDYFWGLILSQNSKINNKRIKKSSVVVAFSVIIDMALWFRNFGHLFSLSPVKITCTVRDNIHKNDNQTFYSYVCAQRGVWVLVFRMLFAFITWESDWSKQKYFYFFFHFLGYFIALKLSFDFYTCLYSKKKEMLVMNTKNDGLFTWRHFTICKSTIQYSTIDPS